MSRMIDADALYEIAKNIWDHADSEDFEKEIFIAIATAPTIEERKTGKWRYSRNISSISYSDMMITCDQCGYTKERCHGDVLNYCPSCGAKMEGNT